MNNPSIDIGFILGIISIILFLFSGPGTRIGLYPFMVGLLMIASGFLLGLATMVISVIRLISGTPSPVSTVLGLVFGAFSFGVIVFTIISAGNAPIIHDITTDTVNPPKFVSVLPLRKNAMNPPEYVPLTAKKQIEAYPDIRSMHPGISPDRAFNKALDAVKALKWTLIDYKTDDGRIEATDTTFWFGFKDDIVIRILPENNGSIVDIRSESRVGGGDIGTNAKRIRKFMKFMAS
jgi:uncharacterized protein (DUF1499 family)